jgi:hypothetical protein
MVKFYALLKILLKHLLPLWREARERRFRSFCFYDNGGSCGGIYTSGSPCVCKVFFTDNRLKSTDIQNFRHIRYLM